VGKRREAKLVLADEPDPTSGYSEVDVVRLCWHLSVEQDWPVLQIANRLTELGIPTRAGAGIRWQESVVYQILTNTITKGERRYRTRDGVEQVEIVPGILTSEQWDRAQSALVRHRRASTRNPAMPFLLRDLMRCGVCGAAYTPTYTERRTHKGVKYGIWRHYACHTRLYARLREHRGAPYVTCRGMAVDADKLEAVVWADVEQYIRNPGKALALLAERLGTTQESADATRKELAELEQQAAATQAERDKILTL
jgi:site-specific DNA recombinase